MGLESRFKEHVLCYRTGILRINTLGIVAPFPWSSAAPRLWRTGSEHVVFVCKKYVFYSESFLWCPFMGHCFRRRSLWNLWFRTRSVWGTQHKRYELNSFKLMINYSWRKRSCNSFCKPLTTYISRPSIANDVGNCKPSPRYYVYCCPYFNLNSLITLPNNVSFWYGSKTCDVSFSTDL